MAEVGNATLEEIPALADTPEKNRLERLRRFFAAQLRFTVPHGGVLTNDELTGAASWQPPEQWKVDPVDRRVRVRVRRAEPVPLRFA